MKVVIQIAIVVLLSLQVCVAADLCEKEGLWGDKCANICGFCVDDNGNFTSCNVNDGSCPETCAIGYTGERCDEFDRTCSGIGGCNGGQCIAPNTCLCGEDIDLIQPNCENLRLRGLMGSGIAICTLTLSILFCTWASTKHKHNKRRS